jgi:hypothetical protein
MEILSSRQEYEAKYALLESEAQVLRGKLLSIQVDHEALTSTMHDTADKLTQVQISLKSAEKKCIEKESQMEDMVEEARSEKERMQKYSKTQQALLRKEVQMVMEHRRAIEVELEESNLAFQRFRREAITAEERNSRDFHSALNELVIKITSLEKANARLKNEAIAKQLENEFSKKQMAQSLEASGHEGREALKSKKALETENFLLKERITGYKDELIQTQKKLEHFVDECNKKSRELENSNMKVRDYAAQHDAMLSQLHAKTKTLTKERKEASETAGKSKALLQREKRKVNAYRQKVLEAQTQNVHAKQFLHKMSQEGE